MYLSVLEVWFDQWHITINPTKSNALFVSKGSVTQKQLLFFYHALRPISPLAGGSQIFGCLG
jgi:hypothetical protein